MKTKIHSYRQMKNLMNKAIKALQKDNKLHNRKRDANKYRLKYARLLKKYSKALLAHQA
jgi:hypothetical protein